MKKIVITGHSGFIGQHLVSKLQDDYSVIGIANTLQKKQSITEIKKDVRTISPSDIPGKIDCIIHLAALSDVTYCQKFPQKCFDINVTGTQKMLEVARKKNSKFIFISTSHVYGYPKKLPLSELTETHPQMVYPTSKLMGELACNSYANSYDLDITVLRLFSVYGPYSPKHLVINKIISQTMKSNKLKLGNLKPKRDFIFILDVISAIELMIKNTKNFNIFNIGSGKNFSILQICKKLEKISGKKLEILPTKKFIRTNEIPKIQADISKIKKLSWLPTTSIDDGLKYTWQWLQERD